MPVLTGLIITCPRCKSSRYEDLDIFSKDYEGRYTFKKGYICLECDIKFIAEGRVIVDTKKA